MTSKLILAAGVAVLALAAPAAARPGGNAGERITAQRDSAPRVDRSAMRADRSAMRVERSTMRAERPAFAERRFDRPARSFERQQIRAERPMRAQVVERQQIRAERPQPRFAEHRAMRADRIDQTRARNAERRQAVTQRVAERRAIVDQRIAERQATRAQRVAARAQQQGFAPRFADARGRGLIEGCPPGLFAKNNGCLPPGQAAKLGLAPVITANNVAALRAAQIDGLNRTYGTRLLAPATAASLLGMPLAQATGMVPLMAVPQSVSYLYPDTNDYYYRYGDGYLYQVDRSSSLISALLPLLAGGLMPGQYLPQPYMSSYVPDYYGLNSFYPTNYSYGYGSPYGGSPYSNLCNRYANGVVYQIDCMTGMIVDVVPLYAGGYGVGQMLPSAYYNVPYQYRDLYYDTADTGYYYAPGAIYQYDPRSSLITSVAALLSPGFGIGQPLPMGYSTYNVPYAYRDTYYDTPNAWYRYNNGNIYQIDPATQIVTAIVASILT